MSNGNNIYVPGKLGKLAKRVDPRTLVFSNYLGAGMPNPPKSCGWGWNTNNAVAKNWGVMKNDSIGDCTCAAMGHMVMNWVCNALKGAPKIISDDDILKAYEGVTSPPYNPVTGANDNGSDLLTCLNYWKATGVGGDKISSYAEIDLKKAIELQRAIYLLGGAYLGVNLPLSVQKLGQGQAWDVPKGGPTGDGAPGSWGGHCVDAVAYLPNGNILIVTWGYTVQVTPAFLATYFDEGYAVLNNDWLNAAGVDHSGFNLAQLEADLTAITQ